VSTSARLEDNIGFACTDLQCRLGRESAVAVRWLGSDGERTDLTFGQLAVESTRFAAVLTKLGVAPGARVFIMLPKLPEVFIAFLGGLKARAVMGPLFANFGDEALLDRLGDSHACVLLTKHSLLKKVHRIRDRLPDLRHVLLVDADDHLSPTSSAIAASCARPRPISRWRPLRRKRRRSCTTPPARRGSPKACCTCTGPCPAS